MTLNTYLLIITLNVNGLKDSKDRMANWLEKQEPTICCLQETHLRAKNAYKLKVRGWEKILQVNGQDRKAGVAILI